VNQCRLSPLYRPSRRQTTLSGRLLKNVGVKRRQLKRRQLQRRDESPL
jgi:hypothetical protein